MTAESADSTIQVRALAEAWAGYPMPWDAKLSPDGKWLAWSWSGLGAACDVYVAPTDARTPPLRLTESKDHVLVRGWSPDSRFILAGRDKGGDEREQLLLIDPAKPFEVVPLTAETPDFFLYGGVLHPNGEWLFYCAQFDPHDAQGRSGASILRQDLATGEIRTIARMLQGEGTGPLLSPDGNYLLYHRRDGHPAGSQVFLVDAEGTADRLLLDLGDRVAIRAQWLGDGAKVLVQAQSEAHERVGLVDLADTQAPVQMRANAGEHAAAPDMAGSTIRWLIDDPAWQVETVVPSDDGREVMIVEGRNGRTESTLLRLADGTRIPVECGSGDLLPIASMPDGGWIGAASHTGGPTEFARFDPAGAEPWRYLSDARSRVPAQASPAVKGECIRWQSVDGLEIQGWLYRPRGAARGLVVWVHGGPNLHSGDELDTLAQCMVAGGFAVLEPNYRGSTYFGVPFRESIKKDGWGGREQDDIRTGIQHLIAIGEAKRGRIGIAGLSYGGFSSWHAVTKYPDLIAAAAPICGMTDLAIDYEETHLPHGRLYSEEMMGGKPEEQAQRYFERSPINQIGNIRGKLLIVHGLRDPNVSPRNTEIACAALKRAGIPFELLTFDDEGHGVWRTANRRILFERLLRLFGEAFAAA
ncbi:MAG: prolyl oligopeptidase family serine peptidase [Dongiaceae bacterium]